MAAAWLQEHADRPRTPELRFDAIGVTIDARGRPRARSSTSRARSDRGERSPERELLVGHRLERHAVQRRDAEPLDRGAVLGRRVADVGANSQPG